MSNKWEYKECFSKGYMEDDWSGHYEVTNGDIALCTIDDPLDITESENYLQRAAKALNDSDCKFYVNTAAEHALHNENMLLRNALEEIADGSCDYETVDYGVTVHSKECKACKAKVMLKSIKRKTNDTTNTGTNKG